MMRFCPQCGDYYADNLLAFCLADGAPLADVDPRSERWNEGARVIEEKASALKRQQRKLKRRRVVLRAATLLVVVMVVCVAVVNSLIYLELTPQEDALDEPSTPATPPAVAKGSTPPRAPSKTSPTAKPKPTATPKPTTTPTPVKTSTPPPDTTTTTTTTYPPTVTLSPTLPSITSLVPTCSEADQSRERQSIIRKFGERWRQSNAPAGADNREAELASADYQIVFAKGCMAGSVTARYVWRVKPNAATAQVAPVLKVKKYACMKIGGVWLCS
jgi:hypothetical protein